MSKEKGSVFKKHLYAISMTGIVLLLLLLVGFMAAYNVGSINVLDRLEKFETYSVYLFFWRLLIYGFLIGVWTDFVKHCFRQYAGVSKERKIKYLVGCRRKLIVYIALFEVLIVHNLLFQALSVLGELMYGR